MTYAPALEKAWAELKDTAKEEPREVTFLGDTYEVDPGERRITSRSCNVPAKDHLSIILLHYLIGSAKAPFHPSGVWVSFKDIEGGAIYYPAYRESVILPLLRKYGTRPDDIVNKAFRLGGKGVEAGDVGLEVVVFKDIRVRIIFWKGDEEFPPEATLLYDKNITAVFSTEDIAVLSRLIAHTL